MSNRCLLAGLTVVALLMGCSTHYVPHKSGRLSIVMKDGSLAYQRDEDVFLHGFAGKGLVDAVKGNAEAIEAAETFSNRSIGGAVATLLGSVCLVGGTLVLAMNEPRSSQAALAAGTLLCGLAGYLTGFALSTSAQPFQLDAINIYNDHVDTGTKREIKA